MPDLKLTYSLSSADRVPMGLTSMLLPQNFTLGLMTPYNLQFRLLVESEWNADTGG
jgi:hypothetical protein